MTGLKFTYILLMLCLLDYSTCINISRIYKRAADLNGQSKKMYGDVRKNWREHNVYKLEDILYPRGDKDKLAMLSSLWRNYYNCLVRSMRELTNYRQLPLTTLMVYVGAVARLSCPLCVAPNELSQLKWMFTKSTKYNKFSLLQENERMVTEATDLTIYHMGTNDAGFYRCHVGDTTSLLIVEVVDSEENYTVVKPHTSTGPYSLPGCLLNSLRVFTYWSTWSECSVCGKVGRRHRYGFCYVKMHRQAKRNDETRCNISDGNIILREERDLFQAFPDGIPCRSQYLPKRIRDIKSIRQRRSEIMIAMCKVACRVNIYKVVSSSGTVVETANNTGGVFALEQLSPKQPPVPSRDIIFTYFGQRIVVRCPGTTLHDVPVIWRCGTKLMVPRVIDKVSGGRIYLNARGHLIMTKVLFKDANTYSCWQGGKLAGTVKISVGHVVGTWCDHHLLLLLMVVIAVVVILSCEHISPKAQQNVFTL